MGREKDLTVWEEGYPLTQLKTALSSLAYTGSKKVQYREGKVRERRGRGGIEGKNEYGMVDAVAKVYRVLILSGSRTRLWWKGEEDDCHLD